MVSARRKVVTMNEFGQRSIFRSVLLLNSETWARVPQGHEITRQPPSSKNCDENWEAWKASLWLRTPAPHWWVRNLKNQ